LGLRKKQKKSVEEVEQKKFAKFQKRRERSRQNNFQDERQSNEAKISNYFQTVDDDQMALKNYRFIVEQIEDLPADLMGSLERMRIPMEKMKENFEILLNVISFGDKHIPRRR
jgi:hypothetical protein